MCQERHNSCDASPYSRSAAPETGEVGHSLCDVRDRQKLYSRNLVAYWPPAYEGEQIRAGPGAHGPKIKGAGPMGPGPMGRAPMDLWDPGPMGPCAHGPMGPSSMRPLLNQAWTGLSYVGAFGLLWVDALGNMEAAAASRLIIRPSASYGRPSGSRRPPAALAADKTTAMSATTRAAT